MNSIGWMDGWMREEECILHSRDRKSTSWMCSPFEKFSVTGENVWRASDGRMDGCEQRTLAAIEIPVFGLRALAF